MNKLSALALGTAFALSAPLAALAQETGTDIDTGVGVEIGVGDDLEIGVDAGVDGTVEAPATDATVSTDTALETELSGYTFGDLDNALQGAAGADLSGFVIETGIEIVTLSSLADEGDFTAEAFAGAREDHLADIGVLQSNVEDNPDIVAALDAEGYTSENVVGVWTQADGTLTVFVDDEIAALDGTVGTQTGIDMSVEPTPGTDTGVETETEIDTEIDAGAETTAP